MERHACKICFKRFPTVRALGGHMRCHAAATSSGEAQPPPSEGWMQSYRLRENPRKSVRLADAHFSSPFAVAAFDAALADGSYSMNSDAESHPAPDFHRQRSKRRRRRRSPPEAAPATEPVSSLSDITTEEDVAISLVLLSRQAWIMEEAEQNEPITVSDDHSAEAAEQIIAGKRRRSMPEPPQVVRREPCRKEFSSCQALGGQRASYKMRNLSCAASSDDAVLLDADANFRHECGICSRVFSSGQALDGHRRAHLCSSSVTTVASSSLPSLPPGAAFLFDLNRPPPDDAGQLSAVSDDCDSFGS